MKTQENLDLLKSIHFLTVSLLKNGYNESKLSNLTYCLKRLRDCMGIKPNPITIDDFFLSKSSTYIIGIYALVEIINTSYTELNITNRKKFYSDKIEIILLRLELYKFAVKREIESD